MVALAETVLPAGRFLPAAGEETVHKVEEFATTLPGPLQTGLVGLLRGLDAQAWLRERRPFARVAPDRRLRLLEGWRDNAVRRLALRALVSPLKIAHLDNPQLYERLGCVYELERPRPEAKPAYMRDRVHAGLDGDLAVECDVVVIGTGAGGAVVGRELAEAGLAVVFVEEGRYFDRTHFNGRAFAMQQKLYRRGGLTFSIGNVLILIPLG